MTVNQAQVRRYYDGMTFFYRMFYSEAGMHYGIWHEGTRTLKEALFNHKRTMLAALQPLSHGDHLLDAGCGVGATSFYIAQHSACDVTGITLSPVQAAVASRLVRRSGPQDMKFVTGDYCNSGFADQSFSHILASESFCHATDKPRVLKEMARLLKPGGKLVIADFFLNQPVAENNSDSHALYQAFTHGFMVPNIAAHKDVCEWIKAAGFITLQDNDISALVAPTARYIRRLGLVTLPLGYLLHWLKLSPAELLPHLRCCILQPEIMMLGTYRLMVLELKGVQGHG